MGVLWKWKALLLKKKNIFEWFLWQIDFENVGFFGSRKKFFESLGRFPFPLELGDTERTNGATSMTVSLSYPRCAVPRRPDWVTDWVTEESEHNSKVCLPPRHKDHYPCFLLLLCPDLEIESIIALCLCVAIRKKSRFVFVDLRQKFDWHRNLGYTRTQWAPFLLPIRVSILSSGSRESDSVNNFPAITETDLRRIFSQGKEEKKRT